ncbi:hypothetical protein [Corynebacterium phoceense]|uniref:hypothetical protein n=1 Tax=Corynebacterium phoceense TaxID=1686286 RepID=UPI00211CC4B5|nr:hypothetical protein [Corynebacterium phoceense]
MTRCIQNLATGRGTIKVLLCCRHVVDLDLMRVFTKAHQRRRTLLIEVLCLVKSA